MQQIKYRFQFSKLGSAAFLGHLEWMNVIRRALRRMKLPLKYSEGFHPHPKLSFGKALPVGIESECEFCDAELFAEIEAEKTLEQMNNLLPEGVSCTSVNKILSETPSITSSIAKIIYAARVNGSCDENAVLRFNSSDKWPISRRRKDSVCEVDLKDYISELVITGNGVIRVALNEREPSLRIHEALGGIFGFSSDAMRKIVIRKIELCQTN